MECDHRVKGKRKGQFLGILYFWIDVLGLLPYEGTTFIPNLSSEKFKLKFTQIRKLQNAR